MANWVWAQFFGKGLADPPDDLSRANPPVHPELLDALAQALRRPQVRPPRPDPDDRHLGGLRALVGDGRRATSTTRGCSRTRCPGRSRPTRWPTRWPRRPTCPTAIRHARGTGWPSRSTTRRPPARSSTPSAAARGRPAAPRSQTPPLSLRQSLLLIGGDVIESKVASLNGYLANAPEARARARGARREPLPPDPLPAADAPRNRRAGRPS